MYLPPLSIIYGLVYQNSHIKLVVVVNSPLQTKKKKKEEKKGKERLEL